MDWNEILGFGMDEQNAEKCGKENLLADIIFEMTFFGFDENKVNNARKEMMAEFEECKSLSAEEHIENLILTVEPDERPDIAKETPEAKRKENLFTNLHFHLHFLH